MPLARVHRPALLGLVGVFLWQPGAYPFPGPTIQGGETHHHDGPTATGRDTKLHPRPLRGAAFFIWKFLLADASSHPSTQSPPSGRRRSRSRFASEKLARTLDKTLPPRKECPSFPNLTFYAAHSFRNQTHGPPSHRQLLWHDAPRHRLAGPGRGPLFHRRLPRAHHGARSRRASHPYARRGA